MANTQLHRTPSGAGNRKTFTLSFWVKRTKLSTGMYLAHVGNQESNPQAGIEFNSDDTFTFWEGGVYNQKPTRKFRDVSAWYHFVIAVDTTQATEANRVKIYVNGVQETVMTTNTFPSQNADLSWNSTQRHTIGAYYNNQSYFDGLLSHIHFIDGTAYAASTFGSTDSTTGEWKINTAPSVTYGSNGFFILKDGNSVTDQSGNSNNFTVASGTLTQTEDCPSNVFATMNPVIRSSTGTFASGNNKFTTSGGAWGSGFATLGMFNGQGKYYMEFKGASGTKIGYGISDFDNNGVIQRTEAGENRYCGEYANSYAYHYGGNFYYSGSSTSTGYNSFTSSNVIGMAVDMDNLKIYFHKDGTYQDSKNPASNNGYTIVAPAGAYLPTICVEDAGAVANFGNGVFDTTAISSEGSNASGIGKFEYDVPAGYTALSTKGLNE